LLLGERAHYELAAGRDVAPLIAAYERFASEGGMMPEQIWGLPSLDGLIFGCPAGSAMPLVWAHAEYLKLLRSALDESVFDRIPPVERRYARGHAHSKLEVFKLRRPVKRMEAGRVLRITAQQHFRVLWTADGWKTSATTESTALGYAGSFADVATRAGQTGQLSFTLFWTEENRWEGRNFDVAIEEASTGKH
jgi:glucoamylase